MFRWLRELRNPALRCERRGHDWKEKTRRGWEKPSKLGMWGIYGYVADRVKQVRVECGHCKTLHPEKGNWETVDREGLCGISLPSEDYEKLEREGFLLY